MIDYFGKNADGLRAKKLWLLDMDGTIYNSETLFDGVPEFLNGIVERGGEYVFITNNSSASVKDYIRKVTRMGITAAAENFFTSTQATALYLRENFPGAKVYCQGTKSFVNELRAAGIDATEKAEPVDAVVVGFDTELTTEKLCRTCEILATRDVAYIATNPDLVCPVSFGFVPDCGSICQMIANAVGKNPLFIGKPAPAMIEAAMTRAGRSVEETVIVGDRIYTDIAAGANAGISTVCVLTGETTPGDMVRGEIRPTFTFKSVKEMLFWARPNNA